MSGSGINRDEKRNHLVNYRLRFENYYFGNHRLHVGRASISAYNSDGQAWRDHRLYVGGESASTYRGFEARADHRLGRN